MKFYILLCNKFKMGDYYKSGLYCIYCGSPNVGKITMKKGRDDSPRSLTAQIGVVGAGYSGGHSDSSEVYVETYFCKRCNMIEETKGTIEPGTVELTDNNSYSVDVILPESVLILFNSMGLEDSGIKEAIKSISRRLKQIIKKFEKTGADTCKKGKLGLKAKMTAGNTKVDVYVLVENKIAGKCARIVYGGGWSYCK